MINSSIIEGIVPEKSKIALVKPIPKKGDLRDKNNFRPISLLSCLGKLIEKTMLDQITKYFQDNEFFYSKQYGFKEKNSTVHALDSYMNYVYKNCDKSNKSVLCVSLDIKKCFDSIKHDILLNKLESYGIEGNEKKWFFNYIKNRKQLVKINDKKSCLLTLNNGVAQGSHIAPFLASVYLSDMMVVCSENDNLISYADDTQFQTTISSPEHVDLVQEKLDNIWEWFKNNGLVVHPEKTTVILHGKKRNIELLLGQKSLKILDDSESTKILGDRKSVV